MHNAECNPNPNPNLNPCSATLLNPLLALLQSQQPRIAFAPLMLGAHQCPDDSVVRHFGQCVLIRLHLSWQTVELWPVDLLLC